MTLDLLRCQDCSCAFAPRTGMAPLSALYEEMTDDEYVASEPSRRQQFRRLLDLALERHPAATRILDIGAGIGSMVAECRSRGLQAEGVEPSRALVRAAAERHQVALIPGVFPTPALDGRVFDIIFLTDVIEHVEDPHALLSAATAALAPGGILVVTTPDLDSVPARSLGRRWWHFRLAHVSYFSVRSFQRLARRSDLEIRHTAWAKWYLSAGYLAARLAAFVGMTTSDSPRVAPNRAGFTVPLNLFDSRTFVLSRPGPGPNPARRSSVWRAHVAVMRLDYWIKNTFVLPGILMALSLAGVSLDWTVAARIVLGLLATVSIASSNYVLNELLDAETDRHHPEKRHRPFASRLLRPWAGIIQWLALFATGCLMAQTVSVALLVVMVVFWCMGVFYNLKPIRTKDQPYLDVVSEAVNNPIRLHAGWFMVTSVGLPPLSISLSYWMIGSYFMALKRYAELEQFPTLADAGAYRQSFRHYTPTRLLASAIFYVSASMLFFGAFAIRYKFELLLSYPAIAWTCAVYFVVASRPGSAASAPERLYREGLLMVSVVLTAALMGVLLFSDLPALREAFASPLLRTP